ncbi:MAG: helix-turn-helix domain-containing protein [Hyphomicrobium sp.]|uniref:helix-turn-helix transcriptional regulator n=1 Tax=Hyphomicrobium sp. TaxID=82 RepID=UPI003D1366D1
MYERAAKTGHYAAAPLLPIWHIDRGRALFVGPLGRNALHAHSVPVYVAGLNGPIRFRVAGGAWRHLKSAVIPAGVAYEFDAAGDPLAVLYLEPSEAGVEALVPLLGAADETSGALVGAEGPPSVLREVYEACDGARWVGAAIDDVLGFSGARAWGAIDPRIARAIASLASGREEAAKVADAAREVGLSASRFQHLFVDEVGVPFRRFRLWQRLRAAIGAIAAGSRFTDAAHDAGFFDQAHFARAFRATFGAPATPSLRHVRRG